MGVWPWELRSNITKAASLLPPPFPPASCYFIAQGPLIPCPQGSAYDRRQRQFVIHNPRPPTLATAVSPADVEPFRPGSAAAAAAGGAPASEFAVYSDASKRVTVLAAGGSLSVSVPGTGARGHLCEATAHGVQ